MLHNIENLVQVTELLNTVDEVRNGLKDNELRI